MPPSSTNRLRQEATAESTPDRIKRLRRLRRSGVRADRASALTDARVVEPVCLDTGESPEPTPDSSEDTESRIEPAEAVEEPDATEDARGDHPVAHHRVAEASIPEQAEQPAAEVQPPSEAELAATPASGAPIQTPLPGHLLAPSPDPVLPVPALYSSGAATSSVPTPDEAWPETLAAALPVWPEAEMLYSDVHIAMYDSYQPTFRRMSLVDVDMSPIDTAIAETGLGTVHDVARYLPFLIRALCRILDNGGEPINVELIGEPIGRCMILEADTKRLSALADDVSVAQMHEVDVPTVTVEFSSSIDGQMSIESGEAVTPTISFVHRGVLPPATTGDVALLAMHDAIVGDQAGDWIDLLRQALEQIDWNAELRV